MKIVAILVAVVAVAVMPVAWRWLKRGIGALTIALALTSCAPKRVAVVTPSEAGPTLEDVLRVVGRWGVAHACPMETDRRYLATAAHVIDPRPFDKDVPAYPVRWSDASGNEGEAMPEAVLAVADLAYLRVVKGTVRRWFSVATEAPRPGDRVRVLGYRRDSRQDVLADRPVSTRVTRVVAGHVVYLEGADLGSSGSCLLNDRDEVVGVNAWDVPAFGGAAGVAVGMWGPWAPRKETP